ncbi:metallophosphoesterase superfamily enzyme [Candidatus Mancarchaeum acidiphilum]|uniref:Metallophosphoesterase superfamily enzyme n=1 Tax=Candidatus Mancarchaeum acidiphilum TaxID=1920749 RepID=A0A218NLS8_9ARCH|nr:metallophosphoesterase [Candidatus Mancarchaeum acidiphilum]ASI13423.1 metallophosphoesterase superfamily enzyme [Candidatus Mancarchaeum acidiphilum]
MRVTNDIELVDGLPIAYVHSLDSLAVADLHLGYEGVMAKRGILVPKANLKSIEKSIKSAVESTSAKNIIVDGDIKNDFSDVDVEEFNELFELIHFLKDLGLSITLIKGNHDNFVERYKDTFNLKVYRQETLIGKYLFLHGEELPAEDKLIQSSTLIMGHEHPAISIYTEAGAKEKLKCFLYGKYKGKPILVLPAMSYFSGGTDINIVPKNELLSPLFKDIDIDSMEAYPVGYGSTMDFGTVEIIKKGTF